MCHYIPFLASLDLPRETLKKREIFVQDGPPIFGVILSFYKGKWVNSFTNAFKSTLPRLSIHLHKYLVFLLENLLPNPRDVHSTAACLHHSRIQETLKHCKKNFESHIPWVSSQEEEMFLTLYFSGYATPGRSLPYARATYKLFPSPSLQATTAWSKISNDWIWFFNKLSVTFSGSSPLQACWNLRLRGILDFLVNYTLACRIYFT